ncbi:MAG: DUF359 domain-containing protein [Candidatus Thorarchaeota archaeon]|jgi:uncharacterized protein (UPF0218 family)/phosphopantetheine adenylyltransferase
MVGTWALNLFDRLHIGHHAMIDILSDMPDPVAAVFDGELVSVDLDLASLIQPLPLRVGNLKAYLSQTELDSVIRVETILRFEEFLDIKNETTFLMFEGPCCAEIEENAIEMRREKRGLEDNFRKLKPFRAGDGDKMSSARVRCGDVDRRGRSLKGTTEPPRRLETNRRSDLKAPKGDVFHVKEGPPEQRVVKRLNEEQPLQVIAVGDVTCATIIEAGFQPDVSVVDGITKRGKFEGTFTAEEEYVIFNPAATIYPEAWSAIDTAINDGVKSLVIVEGEEDLMGFPAVLLAPIGSVMLYGQPDVGIVWVPVTDENQNLAKALLNNMPKIN